MTTAEVGACALAVTLAATPLVITAARRAGIMDRPGVLKVHTAPVPYLGGVAVLAGVAVGALAGRPVVLVPLTAAMVLGAADDRFALPAWTRLVGQLCLGALVAVACPVHLPGVAGTLLIIGVTAILVNGVNLLDGLDMLAAGVVAVAAGAFAVQLDGWGRQLGVALAAALVGFLFFNRPPARVYLGDGGAYLLGTALAVLLAATWAPGLALQRGVASVALVAVPAAEVAFAVVRRIRGRISPLAGDRAHPYDRLVAWGWPRPAATLAYVAVEAAFAAGALVAARRSSVTAAVALDVAAAGLLVLGAAVCGALAPDQTRA